MTEDEFENWLCFHDTHLGEFFELVGKGGLTQLDYSLVSLDQIERWLLDHFSNLRETPSVVVDGIARYFGEVLETNGEVFWCLDENPKSIYHGFPIIRPKAAPLAAECPHKLVQVALLRREGHMLQLAAQALLGYKA
jgi:hypothetical protein